MTGDNDYISAEDIQEAEHFDQCAAQHQQELDHQQIRDEEILKLLRLYNTELIKSLIDAYRHYEGMADLFEIKAQQFILSDDAKDINL